MLLTAVAEVAVPLTVAAEGTSGIFLTSFTRPESKMKLREMKELLADRASDGQRERVVKGDRPVAKRGLVRNWQGCVKPLGGKP